MKEIKVEQNKYANFPIKRSASDDSSNANDVKGIHKSNPTDPMVNMIPFGKLELNKTVEENTRKFDSQSQTIKPKREVTRSDSKTKLSQTIQPKNHKSMNDNLPDLGIPLYNLNAPNPNEEETTKRFEENLKKFNQPPQKVNSQQEKIDSIKSTKNIKKSDNLPYTGVIKYKENYVKPNTKSSSPNSSTPRITEKRVQSDSFS
uniref:Uncharacterized protein n=1 Tax=Acrobeloides nanus TaxID=290746 RepID=A0A914CYC5_9BILA